MWAYRNALLDILRLFSDYTLTCVPDNQRYWQVFQDDKEINEFLQNKGKFKGTSIDGQYDNGEEDIEVN